DRPGRSIVAAIGRRQIFGDETAGVTRRAIDDEVEVPLHDVGPPRDPGELSSDPCAIAHPESLTTRLVPVEVDLKQQIFDVCSSLQRTFTKGAVTSALCQQRNEHFTKIGVQTSAAHFLGHSENVSLEVAAARTASSANDPRRVRLDRGIARPGAW